MSEGLKLKIRKELNRWSRKLLYSIGLEDIGKQLVGEAKWQNLYPVWRDLEERTAVDFDPSSVEPDIPDTASCADLSHADDPSETPEEEEEVEEGSEEKNETLESFFHLLPYWCFINRAFGGVPGQGGLGGESTTPDVGGDITSATNDALDVNQRLNSLIFLETIRQQYAQQVPPGLQSFNHVQNSPFLSQDIFEANKIPKHQSYMSTDSKYHEALHSGLRGLSSIDQGEPDDDEPLDLTQKNKGTETLSENRKYGSREVSTGSLNNSNTSTNTNATDSKTKVSSRPNQVRAGKGYTSQELELALRDIQSGKLGTRRAAVIYGIPRSTLRNKVYKLGKDRSCRPYFRQKNTATNFGEDATSSSNTDTRIIKDQSRTGDTGMIECQNTNTPSLILPHTSLLLPSSASPIPSSHSHSQGGLLFPGGADSDEEEIGTIKSEEDISHEKKVLKEWLRTKLSRQAFQQHLSSPIINERFNSGASRNSAIEPQSDNSDSSDEVSRQDLRKEVILKIPSLINNKSSLSRVISRKKLKRRSPRDDEYQEQEVGNSPSYSIPLLNMLGLDSASAAGVGGEGKNESSRAWKNPRLLNNNENDSMDESDSINSRSFLSSHHGGNKHDKHNLSSWGDYDKELRSTTSTSSNANNNMGPMVTDANGKKSRPKRGKYRNYDREALLKAVRAVQDGQMSVHRAGSFYGVPHSTLEYKVKERHLLRRPKRKETESPKLSSKSSPESSMSESSIPRNNSGTPGADTTSNNSLPLTPDLRESLSRYMNLGSLTSSSFKSPDDARGNGGENSNSLGLGRGISPCLNLNLFNLDDLLIRQNLGTVGNSSSLDLTKK